MILRWHSWIAHVVTLFLTKAIGLPLPTIYKLLCSSGRVNKGSPMLCILLSQKLVLVKVVTSIFQSFRKRVIKDGGEKWIQHKCDGVWWTNHLLCFWENMALSGTPYFPWIPLRDLETWKYGALLFCSFACVQANFFLLDSSMPPFSTGFWGICVGYGWSIYFEGPYLWVG